MKDLGGTATDPEGRAGTRWAVADYAALAGLFVLLGLAVWIDVALRRGVAGCPLRETTGWYCPACGGTRAAKHLLSGDVVAA